MTFRWQPPEKLSKEDICELLREPDNFSAGADNPIAKDPEHWCLGPVIRTRDSGLLEQSNAAALVKALEALPKFAGEWSLEEATHWGCGWVEHLSFRLLDDNGNPTAIYAWLAEWFTRLLEDYPVADDDDYSRREFEATLENIRYAGNFMTRLLDVALPDNWEREVYNWLWENAQESVESRDDRGGYPSREKVVEAMRELGMIPEEEED